MDTLAAPTSESARTRGRPKSAERLLVDNYLKRRPTESFTVEQIAAAVGLPRAKTAQHVCNSVFRDQAHKVPTDSRTPAYKHGPKPSPAAGGAPGRAMVPIFYKPKEPAAHSARPGAMDAYTLPSLVNGERIERRAPVAMSSTVQPRTLGK